MDFRDGGGVPGDLQRGAAGPAHAGRRALRRAHHRAPGWRHAGGGDEEGGGTERGGGARLSAPRGGGPRRRSHRHERGARTTKSAS
eukprot:669105-Prorocentrum_minimum.AAC.2